MEKRIQKSLYQWYQNNSRPLPWRLSRDPYQIWLSETMLQQTTIQTVLPYFEKFLLLFPDLKALAQAPTSQVLSAWAGLGYYSRAKNLHKAAQTLVEMGEFPRTHQALLSLPGFGPYTSRAVSSIAFDERVGVVDGNVIRVLSRYHATALQWWRTKERQKIQMWADKVVEEFPPSEMNQALMDVGSILCTPTKPSCWICPLLKGCKAQQNQTPLMYPLKKAKRPREIWYWRPEIWLHKNKVAIVMNEDQLPFLKNQWVLPGKAKQQSEKPGRFAFRHSITHHDIFVSPLRKRGSSKAKNQKWIELSKLSEWIPASLIKKTLDAADKQ